MDVVAILAFSFPVFVLLGWLAIHARGGLRLGLWTLFGLMLAIYLLIFIVAFDDR